MEVGPTENGGNKPKYLNVPLAKRYFKILQALHHTEILDNSISKGSCPKGMQRQVNKLTTFIKPASPSLNTTTKVKINTNKWLEGNLEILKCHYNDMLVFLLGDLPGMDEEALRVAVGWGRLRYKRKFTISSVKTLRELLTSPGEDPPSPAHRPMSPEDFPPLPASMDTGVLTPIEEDSDTGVVTQGDGHLPSVGTGGIPVTSGTSPVGKRKNKKLLHGLSTAETSLLTFKEALNITSGVSEIVRERVQVGPSSSSEVVTSPANTNPPPTVEISWHPKVMLKRLSDSLVDKRGPNSAPTPPPNPNLSFPISNPTPPPPPNPMVGTRGFLTPDPNPNPSFPMPNPNPPPPSPYPLPPPLDPTDLLTDRQLPPELSLRLEPTIHPICRRKIYEWNLEVIKPILVLGDTNLSAIPTFQDENIQF